MGVLAGIIQNTNTIKDCLADIKEKANAKGADINYGDDLVTWAGKINNIQNAYLANCGSTGTPKQPIDVRIADTFIYPTKDRNGNVFNTLLQPDLSYDIQDVLLNGVRKIVVPEFFQQLESVSFFGNADGGYPRYKPITCNEIAMHGFLFSFWLHLEACGIIIPQAGIKLRP